MLVLGASFSSCPDSSTSMEKSVCVCCCINSGLFSSCSAANWGISRAHLLHTVFSKTVFSLGGGGDAVGDAVDFVPNKSR